jgi:hypothetical protein
MPRDLRLRTRMVTDRELEPGSTLTRGQEWGYCTGAVMLKLGDIPHEGHTA